MAAEVDSGFCYLFMVARFGQGHPVRCALLSLRPHFRAQELLSGAGFQVGPLGDGIGAGKVEAPRGGGVEIGKFSILCAPASLRLEEETNLGELLAKGLAGRGKTLITS